MPRLPREKPLKHIKPAPRYRPISIRQKTLPVFLNETTEKHNGLSYLMFRKLRDAGQNASAMARAFKVNRMTMYDWWKIDDEEQQAVR